MFSLVILSRFISNNLRPGQVKKLPKEINMMIIKSREERDYEIYQGICRLRMVDDYDEQMLAIAEYYEESINNTNYDYEVFD